MECTVRHARMWMCISFARAIKFISNRTNGAAVAVHARALNLIDFGREW